MAKQQPSDFKKMLCYLAGMVIALQLLIVLKIIFYEIIMEHAFNMPVGMAFFFTPMLIFFLSIIAVPYEFLARWIGFKPFNLLQEFLLGAMFITFFLFWAIPPPWALINILINPITLRWLYGRYQMKLYDKKNLNNITENDMKSKGTSN